MSAGNQMKFIDAGLKLIKEFEGFSSVAYEDQGGRWTIGYGTAMNVKEGDVMTEDEASLRLMSDIASVASRAEQMINHELNDNQFSAVVSFAYNLGIGNLAKSTLLNCINKHEIEDASKEFERWAKINGVENAGLLRRRQAERDLFNTA
jgi:lysozyme